MIGSSPSKQRNNLYKRKTNAERTKPTDHQLEKGERLDPKSPSFIPGKRYGLDPNSPPFIPNLYIDPFREPSLGPLLVEKARGAAEKINRNFKEPAIKIHYIAPDLTLIQEELGGIGHPGAINKRYSKELKPTFEKMLGNTISYMNSQIISIGSDSEFKVRNLHREFETDCTGTPNYNWNVLHCFSDNVEKNKGTVIVYENKSGEVVYEELPLTKGLIVAIDDSKVLHCGPKAEIYGTESKFDGRVFMRSYICTTGHTPNSLDDLLTKARNQYGSGDTFQEEVKNMNMILHSVDKS